MSDGHFSLSDTVRHCFTPGHSGDWQRSVTFGRIHALIVRGCSTNIFGGSRTRSFAVVPVRCSAAWSSDYVRSRHPRSRCVTVGAKVLRENPATQVHARRRRHLVIH